METRECQNCKNNFIIEPDDFSFYEKMKVPPPTFCPLCRAERRFNFRNDKKLFKVRDAITNNEIFSLHPQERGKKILTQEEWHSDIWEGMDYARDYDFSENFFKQLFLLEKEIPVYNLNAKLMVNSPYSGNATALKNCHLCFNSNYSEDCIYGTGMDYSKDCIDNSYLNHSERCYDCFWLQNCYQCYFTVMSVDSINMWFCRDCLGCNNCLGCTNLRKSSYCIFNIQYTKDEYEEKIKEFKLNTISGVMKTREISRDFWKTQPTKYHQGLRNLNSTGSYVTDCKNVNDSYFVRSGENMRYCQHLGVPSNKECYDTSVWGENMELHYETCLCGESSYNVKFSHNCWPACRNIEYCMNLFSCSDCFGCVGLKKKQFCILNKQYEKEEYEALVKKIKVQMDELPYVDKRGNIYRYGEFFPIEFSPYGYNNTIAIQHFDMTKEEAIKNGYPWIEVEKGKYSITKKYDELPQSIEMVDRGILDEVIECEGCNGAYRILENELTFYKKEKLPLPTMCSDCRYNRRISDRLKVKLYKRKCMCNGEKDINQLYKNTVKHLHGDNACGDEFKTGYPPDGDEIVYCEKCYQQEVI